MLKLGKNCLLRRIISYSNSLIFIHLNVRLFVSKMSVAMLIVRIINIIFYNHFEMPSSNQEFSPNVDILHLLLQG